MSNEQKKQTAVEWIINVVQSCIAPDYIPSEIVQQALQMEREQIVYADLAGVKRTVEKVNKYIPVNETVSLIARIESGKDTHEEGEEYYRKTYGK